MRILLTVCFDEPFWVGVFERWDGEDYSVCRIVFGAEPKDHEIYGFVLATFYQLSFSRPVSNVVPTKRVSPKRLQRQARRELLQQGIGTKAQQVLKQEYEQNHARAKMERRKIREQVDQEKFDKRQAKKRDKHRGR